VAHDAAGDSASKTMLSAYNLSHCHDIKHVRMVNETIRAIFTRTY